MHEPRFSIVIPTRDRPALLARALGSALQQTHGNLEIIVSDNSSDGATARIVDAVAEEHVRYVRAPEGLLMHDSWTFALLHATGEFVGYLCDDDALHPRALECADASLAQHDAEVVAWRSCSFAAADAPDEARRGTIHFGPAFTDRAWAIDGGCLLDDLYDMRAGASDLIPKVLNGLVARPLIDRLHAEGLGLFRPASPDYAAAAMLAHAARRLVLLDAPLLVAGATAASIGAAGLVDGDVARRFIDELMRREPGLVLPQCAGPPVTWIAQTLLQCAREVPGLNCRRPNPVHVYGLAMREIDQARAAGIDATEWQRAFDEALAGPLAPLAEAIASFADSQLRIESDAFLKPLADSEPVLGVGPVRIADGPAPAETADGVANAIDGWIADNGAPLAELRPALDAWAGSRTIVIYGLGRNGRGLLRVLEANATENEHEAPADGVLVLDDGVPDGVDGWPALATPAALDPQLHAVLVTPADPRAMLETLADRGFTPGEQVRTLEQVTGAGVAG